MTARVKYAKKYYQRLQKDPERMAKRRELNTQRERERRKDPEYLAKKRESDKRCRIKRQRDPEVRAKQREIRATPEVRAKKHEYDKQRYLSVGKLHVERHCVICGVDLTGKLPINAKTCSSDECARGNAERLRLMQKASSHSYYLKNRERLIAQKAQYLTEQTALGTAWHQRNAEYERQKKREWKNKNLEHVRQRTAAYNAKNRAIIKAYRQLEAIANANDTDIDQSAASPASRRPDETTV